MVGQLHQLKPGDRFRFVAMRHEQTDLPATVQMVVSCWGVRTPTGKPLAPWMLACRESTGMVFNFALPPDVGVVISPET